MKTKPVKHFCILRRLLFFYLLPFLVICCKSQVNKDEKTTVLFNSSVIISDGYIGNGVQWDPYELNNSDAPTEISQTDWQKMYERLDFIKQIKTKHLCFTNY
ncbi:MAG: hypothetical protein LBR13_04155 [Dysgonamonadaceae bacterium]|jgi:hypothetical protein|nr:hypothetical protein [Dysgonamonadaceae bacterium]